jgi:hypothetical protein
MAPATVTSSNPNKPLQAIIALVFPFFTVAALGIDAQNFSDYNISGQLLTNALVATYFAIMYYAAGEHLRRLMLVMLPLSYLGEILFCKVLGMYSYRTPAIPLYVPFGHAVVYASGYIVAHTPFALRHNRALRTMFLVSFIALFLYAGIFLNDTFTLITGILFFVLLRRKRWENMYYFIALCVIFIELTGTHFKCWIWMPKVFEVIPTANPPMGAVFVYAGGDVLLAKIVALWQKKKLN